jgi:galactonate dehydratase
VDLHARFTADAFFCLLPALNELGLHWIEEPLEVGDGYAELRREANCPVAAGELAFGVDGFRPLIESGWVDVVMPDVKHVGGFGPLLDTCSLAAEYGVEVSPHNPSGPVSTMASVHAAAVRANVTSLEVPFDRHGERARYAEPIDSGRIRLSDAPGWGIEVPSA